MCGICGIVSYEGDLDPDLLRQMNDALRHRGPDDEGYALLERAADKVMPCGGPDTVQSLNLRPIEACRRGNFRLGLGHRRLSILDLTPAGHQPMASHDHRVWITFNGEIYNYLELRENLRSRGHVFRTKSDTEVLIAGYRQWGIRMLERLVGMFAFALLDLEKRRLLFARDFFGIKPFYYTRWNGGFAFASEVKALLSLPCVQHAVNPQRLYEYLRFGYTDHGDATLFADVYQLPPAHYAELSLDTFEFQPPKPYWQLDVHQKVDLPFEHAAVSLREQFLQSIELHMRSDVPVGVCLSGGIDSSSIAMAMRHVTGAEAELHAFTYVADEPTASEEKWANLVANAGNLVHHKIRLTAIDLVSEFDRFLDMQDEPVGSASPFAQYAVFQEVKHAGIKVALEGQGADEVLGGYHDLVSARFASLLRRSQFNQAVRLWRQGTKAMGAYRTRFILSALGRLTPRVLQPTLRRVIGEQANPAWLNHSWFTTRGVQFSARIPPAGPNLFREELQQFIERLTLPKLLRWGDRNSMCASVENRVPFLTPQLVQFVLALPEEYIIDGRGGTKAVFRRAMRGIVPDTILDRKDKVGFLTPERHWLVQLRQWTQATLSLAGSPDFPCLHPDIVLSELQQAISLDGYYGGIPWRWLNAIHWASEKDITFV